MTIRLMIALVFVLLLAAGAVQAGGDAAHGEELAAECAACHGDDGKGDDDFPAIAGLPEADHVAMLKAFKSGERADDTGMMTDSLADLSEQDMADVAAYYATLQ